MTPTVTFRRAGADRVHVTAKDAKSYLDHCERFPDTALYDQLWRNGYPTDVWFVSGSTVRRVSPTELRLTLVRRSSVPVGEIPALFDTDSLKPQ